MDKRYLFGKESNTSKWNKWPDEAGFGENENFDANDDDEEDENEFDGGWNYYSAQRPRKVVGGIKTKSERGAIGETWWSKRWLRTLESFGMGTRLTRGRSYARQGQVVSLDIQAGIVKSKVQGSMPKPYTLTIELHPLTKHEWNHVADAMVTQALFSAKLLAGEMPQNIEEAFSSANLSLFPTRGNDLHTHCSCPDYANPCKHIAAVYYILAEQFDEDPFLIFKLRGCTKEQLISLLRQKRAAMLPEKATPMIHAVAQNAPTEEPLRLEDMLSTFWEAGDGLDQFSVRPRSPEVEKAILKRLGDAPFATGKENLSTLLSRVYDSVQEVARRKAESEDV
jgi:uncharacterized Zn finger protein